MRTRSLAVAVIAALALIPSACSDDSELTADASSTTTASTTTTTAPAAEGDLEAFCAAGAEIDSATATIDSPETAVTVFADLQTTIDEMVAAAPADVAEDAQAFADHVDDALASTDFTAFEDGTVDALVANFDATCEGDDH